MNNGKLKIINRLPKNRSKYVTLMAPQAPEGSRRLFSDGGEILRPAKLAGLRMTTCGQETLSQQSVNGKLTPEERGCLRGN